MPQFREEPQAERTYEAVPGPRRGGAFRPYLLALGATGATLALRLSLHAVFQDRPLLILFMLPIILSAAIGGLGPGLFATGLAVLGVDFFLVPPVHTLLFDKGYDGVQLLFLVGNGVLVSALTGALHRSRGALAAAAQALGRVMEKDLEAHRALEESEKRFQDIARVSSDWFWEMDREGRFTYVSESVTPILGYTPEEMIGRNVLEGFPPEDLPGMTLRYGRLFSQGEPFLDLPAVLVRRDGSRRQVLSTGTPILDGERLTGFRGLDRDVTGSLAAEEERRRLEAELVQAQKLEAIGRLAGGVAHDFNNMLGVILGQAELAMMLPGSRVFQPHLTEIRKAAQRSAELTRQLLAFARKQTIVPKVLDLNETVQGMLKMLRRLIGEDITLVWNKGEGLGKVRMDPSQIDQILANLTLNARDAIAGVGRITLGLAPAAVGEAFLREHPAAQAGDFVVLSVEDSGCGMDVEILSHIFEPFFTTKDPGQGTGLGLATVFGIVKQNEGFILVDSEPGRGTRFRVFLPRLPEGTEGPPRPIAPGALPAGHGETLLLVEDEPSVLGATRAMLEQLGYKVMAARGPAEALVFAQGCAGAIHLLVTDVVMPDMNGRELSERIQRLHPGLPVLFMSGYTADTLDPQGMADQGMRFLQKPVALGDLAQGVAGLLA